MTCRSVVELQGLPLGDISPRPLRTATIDRKDSPSRRRRAVSRITAAWSAGSRHIHGLADSRRPPCHVEVPFSARSSNLRLIRRDDCSTSRRATVPLIRAIMRPSSVAKSMSPPTLASCRPARIRNVNQILELARSAGEPVNIPHNQCIDSAGANIGLHQFIPWSGFWASRRDVIVGVDVAQPPSRGDSASRVQSSSCRRRPAPIHRLCESWRRRLRVVMHGSMPDAIMSGTIIAISLRAPVSISARFAASRTSAACAASTSTKRRTALDRDGETLGEPRDDGQPRSLRHRVERAR